MFLKPSHSDARRRCSSSACCAPPRVAGRSCVVICRLPCASVYSWAYNLASTASSSMNYGQETGARSERGCMQALCCLPSFIQYPCSACACRCNCIWNERMIQPGCLGGGTASCLPGCCQRGRGRCWIGSRAMPAQAGSPVTLARQSAAPAPAPRSWPAVLSRNRCLFSWGAFKRTKGTEFLIRYERG